MADFDGNAYRKGVLASIEARGGLPASDPFEWYDLPLDDKLKDSFVRAQVDAVWAFWQKQREAPKYRGLVLALLGRHEELAPLLWKSDSRRQLLAQVREHRAEQAVDRFAELDGAVARLVERFGGIPESKVAGLVTFAAERSITEADARQRLSRHPVVPDPVKAGAAVDPYRRARADLEELGRLLESPAPVSLLALLELPPTASRAEIVRARDAVAHRNRESLPDRRRALLDDLLAAVTALLVDGDAEAYLSVLAAEVVESLRPRLAAAVLVEDLLTADDAGYLVAEAEALGLDPARARDVVVQLAREAGVAMPATSRPRAPIPTTPTPAASGGGVPEGYRRRPREARAAEAPPSAWHQQLSAARAALREGRVVEARRLVDAARQLAGGLTPPVRAVSDEVDDVLAEAQGLWRGAVQALAAQRTAQAVEALERLVAIARDLTGPEGQHAEQLLAEVRPRLDALRLEVERTASLPAEAREDALLALWDAHPDAPAVQAALDALGLSPPTALRAVAADGGVTVSWSPSPSRGRVEYRVTAEEDGRSRTVGTTASCALETVAPPGGRPLPTYSVVARRAGVVSAAATTGAAPTGTPPAPVTALRLTTQGGKVQLGFDPAPGVHVRRLPSGTTPPPSGSLVADVDRLGVLVPHRGPGLVVDALPATDTAYVVVSEAGGTYVAGATAWYADLPPVTGLVREGSLLRWSWPVGCTEALLVWRAQTPPDGPDDPAAQRRKVTNTRYEIDGGAAAPDGPDLHVAVFTCRRLGGALVTSAQAPADARLAL